MAQQIRFCTTGDGVRLAFTISGTGPPLVRVLGWLTHLEFEADGRWFGALWQRLAHHTRLVRYDGRGIGLSDRAQELVTAFLDVMRLGWGEDSPTVRQMFAAPFFPDAEAAFFDWYSELQRAAATPAQAVAFLAASVRMDVRPLLSAVRVPTLVIHRRGDQAVPIAKGHELAMSIPGAQFLALEGRNHLPLPGEPAAEELCTAVEAFVAETPAVAPPWAAGSESPASAPYPAGLTGREVEVLQLLAAGRSTREIATCLVISEGTVERHITHLYGKIGAVNRADATSYAHWHGLFA
jgi:DNA-binding CsgD family transcriptional regulator/pimeloyl-ACP methyl ester carboxylesterase